MILRGIRAENFMKFSSLKLTGLPPRGIIGIEGPNESGKTSIGEAVLFAFFGKTRTSLETSVSRLIRWGADYLSVEVEFHVPERGDFLIYREIDKYGTNFVKVIDSATRAEVAAGNVNVSEFLGRALNFDFFEFRHSFYHDQIQDGLPGDSQPSFVERMTGIAQIHESVQGLRKDIEQLEREFAHYQKDIQRNLQQMEKYDRNTAKLPELRELVRVRSEELEQARAEQRRRQEESEVIKRLGEELQAMGRKLDQVSEEPAAAILPALEEIRQALLSLFTRSEAEREFAEKNRDDLRAAAARLEEVQVLLTDFQGLRANLGSLAAELEARLDPRVEQSLVAQENLARDELVRISPRRRRAGLASGVLFLLGALASSVAAAARAGLDLGGLRAEPTYWVAAGAAAVLLALSTFFLLRRIDLGRTFRQLRKYLEALTLRTKADREERERVAALLALSGPGDVLRFIKASEAVADQRFAEKRRQFLEAHRMLPSSISPRSEGARSGGKDAGPSPSQSSQGGTVPSPSSPVPSPSGPVPSPPGSVLSEGASEAASEGTALSPRPPPEGERGGEGEGDYRRHLQALSRLLRELRSRAGREGQRVERAVQDSEGAIRKARGELEKVESEVHECESQATKKEVLVGKKQELHQSSLEIRNSIDLRRLSIELLDDTAASIRNKIGPAFSRFMKELLPRLTQGRYRDIKVGGDLALKVFTSDKSDFLDPAELSGGTHEALGLALRLATSQAFIATRTRQPQFVFLDEPFKMMDEARALEALHLLTELSREIQQVFVIQPNFTTAQRARFDWLIQTSVDMVELNMPPPSADVSSPWPAGGSPSGSAGGDSDAHSPPRSSALPHGGFPPSVPPRGDVAFPPSIPSRGEGAFGPPGSDGTPRTSPFLDVPSGLPDGSAAGDS